MFKIVITEWTPASQADDRPVPEVLELYSQSVDAIDLPNIIAAINRKPRKPRAANQAKGEKK